MRKVLLLTLATLTVVLAGATSTATARPSTTVDVSITASGFVPEEVRVRPGDTVVWKNNDTNNHQVVSDTGVFKSPVLKPGATYSHVFDTESSYSYHDSLKPATGEVHVVLNRVTAGITRPSAVFGSMVEVFGSIPNGATGEEVTVHITPYGGTERTRTVVTEGGTYSLKYKARIKTEFFATWNGTTSDAAPTVLVRPKVTFGVINARQNQFFVRVSAARSYAHRLVRIERLNSRGAWVRMFQVRLNRNSQVAFTGKFARGVTHARASVAASPGYTFGVSAARIVRR